MSLEEQDKILDTQQNHQIQGDLEWKRYLLVWKIYTSNFYMLKNPYLSIATKSYSTSTGGEPRELEDLSELPSEYIELREYTDSESDYR